MDTIIFQFRCCFSYWPTFCWFVIIILGFTIRFDHYGVSSFVRWLFLDPKCYDPMLRFFRTGSWCLSQIISQWILTIINNFPVIKINGRCLIIGDGIKLCKEAKKMPGIKSLHQESDNNGKGEYIRGHHIGFTGILTGNESKQFCVPIHGELHEGVDTLRPSEGVDEKSPTIVTRMARLIVQVAARTEENCYAVLDAYFSTGPAFKIFRDTKDDNGNQKVHLITRAKNNYVGFFDRFFANKRFHENDKEPLARYFESSELFEDVEMTVCGQVKTIQYYCVNLLWKPIEDWIRFVCVKDGAERYILMSSDLRISGQDVITIYLYRSSIEVMFKSLKHIIGGFSYHFWTKAFPKLTGGETLDFSAMNKPDQKKMRLAVEAIERFVNLAGIALGILEYLALTYQSEIWREYAGWLRTYPSGVPSVGVVQSVIQTEFFSSVGKVPNCATLQIVQDKKRQCFINGSPHAGKPLNLDAVRI